MVFGKTARLPLDLQYCKKYANQEYPSESVYIIHLQRRLHEIEEIVCKNLSNNLKSKNKNKNKKHKQTTIIIKEIYMNHLMLMTLFLYGKREKKRTSRNITFMNLTEYLKNRQMDLRIEKHGKRRNNTSKLQSNQILSETNNILCGKKAIEEIARHTLIMGFMKKKIT